MGLLKAEENAIEACTVARDIQLFDLLVEDMEAELGECWGGLDFHDGLSYLASPEAAELEFITVAVDRQDEEDLTPVTDLITAAKRVGIKIILVAYDLTPMALHKLLRLGADDFAPYPLPEGALHDAIERLRQTPGTQSPAQTGGDTRHKGVILPVYGVAGGSGATTFAVNLAWELSKLPSRKPRKICILDLDLQFGSVSTYLDLPRRESVFELLADISAMDHESFAAAMVSFNDAVDVLTAPADSLPLEILSVDDVERLLNEAAAQYDYVIVDLPTTLVHWTETVLQRADIYFALMEMDMRSAQNAQRFVRLLKAEDLPYEKIRYVMNRGPKFTDLAGKGRIKRLAENLSIDIELILPDGGKPVMDACDHGMPLAETAAKNPLRKDIAKLAASLDELVAAQAAMN